MLCVVDGSMAALARYIVDKVDVVASARPLRRRSVSVADAVPDAEAANRVAALLLRGQGGHIITQLREKRAQPFKTNGDGVPSTALHRFLAALPGAAERSAPRDRTKAMPAPAHSFPR
eukprot:gene55177-38381_t